MARILVVDDEETVRAVLSTLLKTRGHDVAEAADGAKALAILKEQRFELMISDIRMPNVDGMTLLKRARSEYPAMAVVMLSAYGSTVARAEAAKLGAAAFIDKPFDGMQTLGIVEAATRGGHQPSAT